MLVLKRTHHQRTFLTLTKSLPAGTVIEVIVTDLAGSWVKLGFVAPESVNVVREEIADRVK